MKIKRDIGKKRTVIGKDIVHENITYCLGKKTIINNKEHKTGWEWKIVVVMDVQI